MKEKSIRTEQEQGECNPSTEELVLAWSQNGKEWVSPEQQIMLKYINKSFQKHGVLEDSFETG